MAAQDIDEHPQAIIFDCFGVLYVDSKQSLLDTIPPEKRDELEDVFTGSNYGYLDRESYLDQVASIAGMSVEQIIDYFAKEHRLNAELVDFIRTKLHGKYKLGLLSNIGRGWIEDFFDEHQLHELFDEVVLSGDVGMTKPSPHIFNLMAERLQLPASECLMIDDIEENCSGANFVGMKSIWYTDNISLRKQLRALGVDQ